ncbi:MAG: hypothetical protein M0Z65_14580 [Firmicutes bacterium]|uniref:Acetyltransferase (GNAT) domain-containing protein n=1 Tax=Melghirimyces thermohalophilus TaxID=1236220 RepID=A0A1G6HKZ5_9BACL|nr:hypothetical protein [Melghirimyces thermohalophilus]MDA8354373.1 hypothetical protein [Bacillota bacterium]SDB94912.1 hypothetical protein SAMN04488112_10148 [Melghirimyces thermohalophilus]
MNFRLRPSTATDFEFVFRLNRTNMQPYVERMRGWDEEAERRDMEGKFLPEIDRIVIVNGQEAGVFAVDDRPDYLFLPKLSCCRRFRIRDWSPHRSATD